MRLIPDFWGKAKAGLRLVQGYHDILKRIVVRKDDIRWSDDSPEVQLDNLKEMRRACEQHSDAAVEQVTSTDSRMASSRDPASPPRGIE